MENNQCGDAVNTTERGKGQAMENKYKETTKQDETECQLHYQKRLKTLKRRRFMNFTREYQIQKHSLAFF